MFELLDDDGLTGLLVDIEARQRRLDAERAAVLAEWDRRQAWANDGSATAAARLARDTGVARSVARERVQVTEKLSSMPHTQAALESLGWPKVRLLANVINDRTAEAFGGSEEKLVAAALELSVDQLGTVLLHWRRLVDEDGANADADSMHAGEYLKISESWRGEVFLNGRFCPEHGAILREAIDTIVGEIRRGERELARQAEANGVEPPEPRCASERRAEALVELAHRGTASTAAAEGGAVVAPAKPSVIVHMDVDDEAKVRARLADGTPIPSADAVRLACDAAVARVLSKNGSVPLDLGRTVRDPSEYQRRAMSALWTTCGYTGCDRPFAWCQLHHVWHWEQGGPTDIGWLIPLCSRHHHQHHRGVFDITRRPDGLFLFARADGTPIGMANPTINQLLHRIRTRDYDFAA